MDKQKQIEEMATDIGCAIHNAKQDYWYLEEDLPAWIAEALVKKYQPKIPEGAVVLTKEESEKAWENGKCNAHALYEISYKQGRKETAEKFATEFHERVNERRSFSLDMMKNSTCDMAQYWNGKINEQSCVRVDIDEICKKFTGETK